MAAQKIKKGSLVWFTLPGSNVALHGIFVRVQPDGDYLIADSDGSSSTLSVSNSQIL